MKSAFGALSDTSVYIFLKLALRVDVAAVVYGNNNVWDNNGEPKARDCLSVVSERSQIKIKLLQLATAEAKLFVKNMLTHSGVVFHVNTDGHVCV